MEATSLSNTLVLTIALSRLLDHLINREKVRWCQMVLVLYGVKGHIGLYIKMLQICLKMVVFLDVKKDSKLTMNVLEE